MESTVMCESIFKIWIKNVRIGFWSNELGSRLNFFFFWNNWTAWHISYSCRVWDYLIRFWQNPWECFLKEHRATLGAGECFMGMRVVRREGFRMGGHPPREHARWRSESWLWIWHTRPVPPGKWPLVLTVLGLQSRPGHLHPYPQGQWRVWLALSTERKSSIGSPRKLNSARCYNPAIKSILAHKRASRYFGVISSMTFVRINMGWVTLQET